VASRRVSAQATTTVTVVAAESFYGDIIQQLGAGHVNVTSIIRSPTADPHEYEPSVADARAVSGAQLVVKNGLGFDAFMDQLLAASPNDSRIVLDAGDLLGKKDGDNPHLWYSIDGMATLAGSITSALARLDDANASDYVQALQPFLASLQPIRDLMAAISAAHGGAHLTQTEPVFGYMGEALGLDIDNGEFQHAIEEGIDPSPRAVAAIRQSITSHQVRALLYNTQTTSSITEEIRRLAERSGVPVVEVSETPTPGKSYQQWMLDQLAALQRALGG
jgi:zinc/manganese transport system substrate-binding protein